MQRKNIYILLTIYAFLQALSIAFFNGTGDAGDSIAHYLFAKHAPFHPELYFDHWAKPVYVLLASPFAQFGFVGLKVFNSIITLATIFLTYKIALDLNLKNALIAPLIMMFSPLYYILTFSGLTEPLFALFVAFGIYYALKQKYLVACILISFLPYIRSEGLIVVGVFALYFMYKHLWKIIPYLLFGSVVYSIAGFFVYHDFLWVFSKIPYAKLSSVYGSGSLLHFVIQLINVVGVPLYGLFWIGLIIMIIKMVKNGIQPEKDILILGGFVSFFVAHTLFWYLGIFNSMGLKRVLIGVMPMIALISLFGFNFFTTSVFNLKPKVQKISGVLILAYVLIFPFTANPSAIQWQKDMMLTVDQKLAIESAQFVLKTKNLHFPIIYSHHYLSEALNIDHFDETKKIAFTKQNIDLMKEDDLLIWENIYAAKESGLTKEDLEKNETLINLYTCKKIDSNKEILFSIYAKRK